LVDDLRTGTLTYDAFLDAFKGLLFKPYVPIPGDGLPNDNDVPTTLRGAEFRRIIAEGQREQLIRIWRGKLLAETAPRRLRWA
jgi:hypothetical protein